MAAGEYVSVSSQTDSEQANIVREKQELLTDRDGEVAELASIYQKRGLDRELSYNVATWLMKYDAWRHMPGTNWGYLRQPQQNLCRPLSRSA